MTAVIEQTTVDWRHGFPAWLYGKHVTVTTNTRQASGEVSIATRSRFGQPFIEFEDGSSIDWHDDEHATITLTAKEQ
ncbi:hypothetical protein ACFYUR_19000 [Micromonospora haikouensis]|uniref:hypothetical protein n=1 Tax=Micromonospora haikouensis TaxID=686309 RepID=UPI00369B4777